MLHRSSRLIAAHCAGLALLLAVTSAFASRSHRAPNAHSRRHAAPLAAHWTPGQRGIDSERTRSIQTALTTRGYLTGEPSGEWDGATEAAMQKFQSDNGWQTRLMPDSRALIKLGLGPNGTEGIAQRGQTGPLQPATGADTLASAHSILN